MSRKLTVLTFSLAALAASGCARESSSQEAAHAQAQMPQASPTPAYAWHYDRNEVEGAKLAYGVAQTDDVLLMLTCEPGSGRVEMSVITDQARPEIVLWSGGDRDRFDAAASQSELGGMLIEAQAQVGSASLARFARTGELAMRTNGDGVSLAAGPQDTAQVAQFFNICRG